MKLFWNENHITGPFSNNESQVPTSTGKFDLEKSGITEMDLYVYCKESDTV